MHLKFPRARQIDFYRRIYSTVGSRLFTGERRENDDQRRRELNRCSVTRRATTLNESVRRKQYVSSYVGLYARIRAPTHAASLRRISMERCFHESYRRPAEPDTFHNAVATRLGKMSTACRDGRCVPCYRVTGSSARPTFKSSMLSNGHIFRLENVGNRKSSPVPERDDA